MAKKEKDKISLKYLGSFLLKYKWHYLMGLIILVVVDIFQLQIPLITGQVTDGLNAGTINREDLIHKVMLLLMIGLVMGIGRFAWRYFIFGTSRKVEYHLRKQYFEHLENMSLSFYNTHKTGELMAYAINDINAIRMMVGPGVLMAFDATVLSIMVIYRMVTTINTQMTILALIPLPLIAVITLVLGNKMRTTFGEKQEAFAKLSEIVQENISGIRVIKAFVQEGKEVTAFNESNLHNYEKNIAVVKIRALLFPMIMTISGLSIGIVLGVGGYFAMIGSLSLGNFVALIQYLLLLVWPMIAVGWCVNIVSMGLASLKRYQSILSIEPDVYDDEQLAAIEDIKGNIRISDLVFNYNSSNADLSKQLDNQPLDQDQVVAALKNINMTINSGETIGIIGRTGSGKSTLMNLLVRLYNPERGTIFIDDVDIMDIPLKVLRGTIGYVPQDNFLFSDSIFSNIGFDGNYSKEDVEGVAKKANVHSNIIDFPDQYETVVGERGVTLSGGQKQRISIARALIKDSSIMILDDSLSAVDTETEEGILNHLKKEKEDKTTIIISHRISTIQDSDKIYVFDEGKIVEEGKHSDLVALDGLYCDMVKKQQLEHELEISE